jgi:tRNA/rRNA methyltransferase
MAMRTLTSVVRLLLYIFLFCYTVNGLSSHHIITTQPRFILVQTSHVGNVGAAARALKTMGFNDLVLVNPRDPKVLRRQRTKQAASGANDVLDKCTVCETLIEALNGTTIWCGTGMPTDMCRTRSIPPSKFVEPRSYFENLISRATSNDEEEKNDVPPSSISFVFGNEKLGMTIEDIDLCHVILGIPTNPEFGSLNLASAVQLIAYDWRQAIGGF